MRISEANILLTDLVAARAQHGDEAALNVFHEMLQQTVPGQTWGVAVPTEFVEVGLPNGLIATELKPGITGITGVVRSPKHVLDHALKGCYCAKSDVTNCVICGKPLERGREHTDACGERCYSQVLKRQREYHERRRGNDGSLTS